MDIPGRCGDSSQFQVHAGLLVHTPSQPVVIAIHDGVDDSKQSPGVEPHVLVVVGGVVDLAAQVERVKLKLITNGGKPYRN